VHKGDEAMDLNSSVVKKKKRKNKTKTKRNKKKLVRTGKPYSAYAV